MIGCGAGRVQLVSLLAVATRFSVVLAYGREKEVEEKRVRGGGGGGGGGRAARNREDKVS